MTVIAISTSDKKRANFVSVYYSLLGGITWTAPPVVYLYLEESSPAQLKLKPAGDRVISRLYLLTREPNNSNPRLRGKPTSQSINIGVFDASPINCI